MITRAYIYRRTLTRPAIYFPVWLWLHTVINPTQIKLRCPVIFNVEARAKVPTQIAINSPAQNIIGVFAPIEFEAEADSEVNFEVSVSIPIPFEITVSKEVLI